MTTPTPQAIAAAGLCLAEAELGIRRGTVHEAALRALRPGGPPLEELEARIAELRAADTTPGDRLPPAADAGEPPSGRRNPPAAPRRARKTA